MDQAVALSVEVAPHPCHRCLSRRRTCRRARRCEGGPLGTGRITRVPCESGWRAPAPRGWPPAPSRGRMPAGAIPELALHLLGGPLSLPEWLSVSGDRGRAAAGPRAGLGPDRTARAGASPERRGSPPRRGSTKLSQACVVRARHTFRGSQPGLRWGLGRTQRACGPPHGLILWRARLGRRYVAGPLGKAIPHPSETTRATETSPRSRGTPWHRSGACRVGRSRSPRVPPPRGATSQFPLPPSHEGGRRPPPA